MYCFLHKIFCLRNRLACSETVAGRHLAATHTHTHTVYALPTLWEGVVLQRRGVARQKGKVSGKGEKGFHNLVFR